VPTNTRRPTRLLNYGHTLAHALEKVALARDGDELRHGEAVAIGLAFAVRLAEALGRVDNSEVVRHDEVLDFFGLNRRVPRTFERHHSWKPWRTIKRRTRPDLRARGRRGFETVSGVDPQLVGDVLERFRGEQ